MIIIVAALVGGAAYVVTQGFGIPTKQDVITELFADPTNGDVLSGDLDDTKRARIADCIEAGSSVAVMGEVNDLTTAKVYVDATTPEGGTVPYEISLVRDGVGWKITGATLYFTSQH